MSVSGPFATAIAGPVAGPLTDPGVGGGGGSPTDPYFANVSALLSFDGADGSTSIVDATGRAWSVGGHAQIDTAQSRFGGASLLLDGDGDYVTTADDGDMYFGAGDFTIEGFARLTGSLPTAGNYKFIASRDAIPSPRGWRLLIDGDAGGKLVFADNQGGTAYILTDPTAFPINNQTHVAVSRVGNTLYLFNNGVLVDSEDVTGVTFNDSGSAPLIGTGRNGGIPVANWSWNGHLDEFRITKGVGRYSANFTPPAAAFPDS